MNLFIIILLMNCVYLFGEKIYKKQLRGMYEEELSKIFKEEIQSTIDGIIYDVIQTAKTGINEFQFTLMCNERDIQNCDYYDGHKEWLRRTPSSILSIFKTYTTREEITTLIIVAVQDIFTDANITKSYKNCCDCYQLEW